MNELFTRQSKALFGLAGIFILAAIAAVLSENYLFILIPFVALVLFAGWKEIHILYFLLLFSLPFSVEYLLSPDLGTDLPDEPLMWLGSVLFFTFFLLSRNGDAKKILQHPIIILLSVTMAWTLVTVLFSTDKMVSLKFLLSKGWYIGAFVLGSVIVFRTQKNLALAAGLLLTSMLLVTLIILFRHYPSGFSFITVNDAVSPFFRNHVNYSAMLVCIIPVAVAVLTMVKTKNLKLLLVVVTLIFLLALFFSYSRGAWLALAAGMIAFWLIKKRWLLYSFIIAIVVFTGVFFWLKSEDRYLRYAHDYQTTIFHPKFSQHLFSTYKLKDISTAERFYRWIAGVRMIKDHALTGSGPGTFYPLYKSYTIPAYKTWVSDNPEHSTVHNYYLLTAIEQGIPGLVFLLFLVGLLLYYAEKLFHLSPDKYKKIAGMTTGVMLVMILVLNFLSDLIETDKIGSLFFICIGLLVISERVKRRS